MTVLQTIYVTKYALTQGILEVQAKVVPSATGDFIEWKSPGSSFGQYAHGNDWHFNKELANQRANEMIAKKIKTTEKLLSRLKALKF